MVDEDLNCTIQTHVPNAQRKEVVCFTVDGIVPNSSNTGKKVIQTISHIVKLDVCWVYTLRILL